MSLLLRPHATRALAQTEAMGRFVVEHRRALIDCARREGLSGEDALDAVQDAVISTLERRDWEALVSRPDEALRLLRVVVRNHARNLRRRRKPTEPLSVAEGLEAEHTQLEESLHRAQRHAALTGCLTTLEGTRRAVVTARLLHDRSAAETATELGLTANHVAVLLHRARADLGECLKRSHFRSHEL